MTAILNVDIPTILFQDFAAMTPRTIGLIVVLSLAVPIAARAQAQPVRNRALFQVTDNDPARWNMILNNMINLKEGVGSEGVKIELVAYGPGIHMLKADSPVKHRIADAVKSGVHVTACQNTMNGMKLTPADMQPEIGYVPSGVVEVMKKQQQGWAYIRS
jgi:intracellular sulfur oxidation DsrE/DsrF family protein